MVLVLKIGMDLGFSMSKYLKLPKKLLKQSCINWTKKKGQFQFKSLNWVILKKLKPQKFLKVKLQKQKLHSLRLKLLEEAVTLKPQ